MRKIDADAFREELIRDRNNDVNMYHSHNDKEIRDEKYNFAIEKLDSQPTVDDWIPIFIKLPKETGYYLCTVEWYGTSTKENLLSGGFEIEKKVIEVHYLASTKTFQERNGFCTYKVLAWQNILEPYGCNE